MKIKYWLMITYFIVMLLPILAIYGIYVSINHFDQKQGFVEYIEASQIISNIEPHLQDPTLYELQTIENYDHLQSFMDETVQINLYRPDGAIVYSSRQDNNLFFFENKNNLYQDLNELKTNHRTFSFKQTFFENNRLTGIYEIVIGRENWLSGVNQRTTVLFVLFSAFFLIIYAAVLFLLHRKFNRPLLILRDRMTKFAQGEPLEKTNVKKNNEIGELLHHFEEMRLQIEEARADVMKQQKEKDFIVSSLSHDLKTPLTVIQTYSEALLKDNSLTEKEREDYKEILFNKLNFMKKMLDDLVTYNALQKEQTEMNFVTVDGEEFFDMLLSGYDELAKKSAVNVIMEKNLVGSYEVHVKQMIRVMDNLMSNAIQHTKKDKTIWLGAFSSKEQLPQWIFSPLQERLDDWRRDGTVILVQNEGDTIPNETIHKIFEPFIQGEKARGQGGSSGLGLSIAKKIIQRHGGKICIWSEEGMGTIVTCWLKEEKQDEI